MHRVYFIAGLPRSGSTLLCNILAQNPRFGLSGTSGLSVILEKNREIWDAIPEHRAEEDTLTQARKMAVFRGIVDGYLRVLDKPVIFDKSRGWPAHLEMVSVLMNEPPKVLCCVRDVRDVLASFEKLFRANPLVTLPQQKENFFGWQGAPGRCAALMADDGVVGLPYNRLRDALTRGWAEAMHFVHYEELTRHPHHVVRGIYDFLEECPHAHDFENIKQVTHEDDRMYGFPAASLHTIKTSLVPATPQWPRVLGGFADMYAHLNVFPGQVMGQDRIDRNGAKVSRDLRGRVDRGRPGPGPDQQRLDGEILPDPPPLAGLHRHGGGHGPDVAA
jgi:sulfotransferase